MKQRAPCFAGVIGDDLLRFGKLPLCLFICIIITAITVVTTAHHTRLLTAQREQLVLERDAWTLSGAT